MFSTPKTQTNNVMCNMCLLAGYVGAQTVPSSFCSQMQQKSGSVLKKTCRSASADQHLLITFNEKERSSEGNGIWK